MSKTIKLCSASELDIIKTFECGQCFRWNADRDGAYRGIALGYPAKLWTENGTVYIRSNAPDKLWYDYFDLSRDYALISDSFQGGEYLDECIAFGRGIRILRQEPWEAVCSFIISQCNNISRIKGIVERLCALYGEKRELDGELYNTFPSAEKLSHLDESALNELRCGYRAAYILSAARAVASGQLKLEELIHCDCELARKELLKQSGIGPKVANCIVLFGLYHMEAFPVDVWIKRALTEHFPKDFDPSSLGACAGLAQQYIFYYARSNGRQGGKQEL